MMIDRYCKDAQSIAKYQKLFENELAQSLSQWFIIQKRKAADPLGQTALFWGFASVALSKSIVWLQKAR